MVFSIERTIGPFHGRSSGSRPPRLAVKASQRPSIENTGTPALSPSGRLVTCRSVPAATLPTQMLPRRMNAIVWRSGDRLNAPASPSAPDMRAGLPLVAPTFQS